MNALIAVVQGRRGEPFPFGTKDQSNPVVRKLRELSEVLGLLSTNILWGNRYGVKALLLEVIY